MCDFAANFLAAVHIAPQSGSGVVDLSGVDKIDLRKIAGCRESLVIITEGGDEDVIAWALHVSRCLRQQFKNLRPSRFLSGGIGAFKRVFPGLFSVPITISLPACILSHDHGTIVARSSSFTSSSKVRAHHVIACFSLVGLVLFCFARLCFVFVFACVPNNRQYVRLCTHAHSHTFQDRFQASATPPKPNETVHHDSHAHLRGTHKSPAHTRLYAPTLRADTRAAGKSVKQVAEDECTKATLAMQVGLMWLV